MTWYIYALIASILFAIIPLSKKKNKENLKHIDILSSIFAFLILLFTIPFLEFPNEQQFYMGAVFAGFVSVCIGFLQLKLSKEGLGRVLGLQTPVQMVFCLGIFLLTSPVYLNDLLNNKIQIIGIVILLILPIIMQYVRKTDLNLKSLFYIMPIAALFASAVIYYKFIMESLTGNAEHVILVYIMVHYLTISVFRILHQVYRAKKSIIINDKIISESLIIACLGVFAYFFMFLAVYKSVNPAYVLAFNLLIPVWIHLFNRYTNKQDDANLKASIIMAIFIGLMIIFS